MKHYILLYENTNEDFVHVAPLCHFVLTAWSATVTIFSLWELHVTTYWSRNGMLGTMGSERDSAMIHVCVTLMSSGRN